MSPTSTDRPSGPVVVIGAGPAGLTAAYRLAQAGTPTVVLEADSVVGGLSRTIERDGWRFDIGGHRFFTKVGAVEELWREILDEDDFLVRPRMSRIYYRGRFFDYPLRPTNALRNLGPVEALRCVASYGWARLRPPKDQTNFEGWVSARFGDRLYRIFFQTYTEKVWGVPAREIQADWAAQRIKNLSLGKALTNALLPRRNQTGVTSLIEEFRYPKYGPGMMWQRARELAEAAGATVLTDTAVTTIRHHHGRAVRVVGERDGTSTDYVASHVISSMPLPDLIRAMDPPPPPDVLAAGAGLSFRDFLTVALVVPQAAGFPDNWIYVHSPDVRVGRIQNYGSWSPYLVQDGRTCLGLEYFVFEGDDLWSAADEDLIALGSTELEALGLLDPAEVQGGYVVRVPKAYPVYDEHYRDQVAVLRRWLETHTPNVVPVGRNGMHRYNNQDHSMVTATLAVENLFGAGHDIWGVNVEAEYHEERTAASPAPPRGTGRAAPVLPRRLVTPHPSGNGPGNGAGLRPVPGVTTPSS